MRRVHGFRIFVVKAFWGRMKDNDPEDMSPGSSAQVRVMQLLDELSASGTQYMSPRIAEPGLPELPVASVTVGEVQLVRSDLVHVEVASGERGSHRKATQSGSEPLDLEDWSPEASHYVTFVFPEDADDAFLVVVHAIRRRDPLRRLLSLMRDLDLANKKLAEATERSERTQARAANQPVPPKTPHQRLLFDARQAADNNYLDEIIGAAVSASALLTRKVPSDRGRDAEHVQRSLSIKLLDDQGKEVAVTAGRRWFGRQRRGEATSQSQGVSELGDLLQEQGLLEDGEAAYYNEASVTVKSATDETTTIAVDTLRDVFTYPVSDGYPPVSFYYERVAPRLKIVAAEEDISVAVLDPVEVEQCLEDLTHAP